MRTAALLALLLAPPASAQDLAPSASARIVARGRAALEALRERGRFPGASAALVLAGGEELVFAVGLADAQAKRALCPADRLCAGSIGKTYVSAAAHLLIQAGRLALEG